MSCQHSLFCVCMVLLIHLLLATHMKPCCPLAHLPPTILTSTICNQGLDLLADMQQVIYISIATCSIPQFYSHIVYSLSQLLHQTLMQSQFIEVLGWKKGLSHACKLLREKQFCFSAGKFPCFVGTSHFFSNKYNRSIGQQRAYECMHLDHCFSAFRYLQTSKGQGVMGTTKQQHYTLFRLKLFFLTFITLFFNCLNYLLLKLGILKLQI